ncbi:hypothetical protein JI735_33625 (plasmid) [Paenibacillus sonchi]|uniref:Uncharacterized protein n=1 Tax=Paenibacillus sonchi TaxID=373687 RepID=A0A974PJF5_9BACL|nr:hypothetical protein [Paenibacillus sonchi]QQZ64593.1 hypothetical protein JI735_33625 [Paenibacillus sonchi]
MQKELIKVRKVEDVPQKQIMSHRRELRNSILKQMGERAAVTEKKVENVLRAVQ